MKTLFTALRAIIYAVLFIGFFAWMAWNLRIYDSNIGISLPDWVTGLGLFLVIIGGIIGLSCVVIFISFGKGTPAVFDPPKEFVAIGLYQYVRNPMYIGGLISLLGFGLFLKSISIVLFFLILSIGIHLFVIYIEEPGLEKRFGESYLDYKKSVYRWIPKWK